METLILVLVFTIGSIVAGVSDKKAKDTTYRDTVTFEYHATKQAHDFAKEKYEALPHD